MENETLLKPAAQQALDLSAALPALAGGGWRASVRALLDALLALEETRCGYRQAEERGGDVFHGACQAFGLLTDEPWPDLPAAGPLLIVANHPFGGADAMVLGSLAMRARPHALMLANEVVGRLPGISQYLLPLSILGAADAPRKNATTLRQALQLLKSGGALAAFPAGEVARWRGAGVEEGPWSPHIASLAQRTGATVIPVRFFGKAPVWLHLMGAIHPLLRTALLPRVMLAARGKRVEFRAGTPIAASDHARSSPEEFAAFLRRATLAIDPE